MSEKKEDNKDDEQFKLNENASYNVVKILAGIPKDLLYIFVPKTAAELKQFEKTLAMWLIHTVERRKVIQLQKANGLPLRPNQSLREVRILVRIAKMKERKRKFGDEDGYSDLGEKS